ncbi:MAG: hypothetical protein LBV47_09265 [Bacteroidales bacterium]|jgi:hypothetical protein|nr:hypothetical protein [Bacteroidales bacterium]
MKKVIISAVISILTVCGVYAQDVKFGFRGGLNLPNIMAGNNDTPISKGYVSRMATGAGIFTELQLNQTISLRLGVEYSEMGGKKDGMQAMPTKRLITEMGNSIGTGITNQQLAVLESLTTNMPQYYYANINNTVKFDYIIIPLMVQFGKNIGQSPWRVYINTGPFVSFFLSGKQLTKGTSKLYSDVSGTTTLWDNMSADIKDFVKTEFPDIEQKLGNPVPFGTTNVTDELKSTNFGITGNLGIRYQYRRNYFFIEAGGNYGLVTVQNDSTNGSNRIGAASIMAGYAFSLF